MSTILIVGASRGIGLELCTQLSAKKHHVIATVRGDKHPEIGPNVDVIPHIDVTEDDCGEKIAHAIGAIKLDTILCNAGVLTSESLQNMDFERILHQYKVNALGPLRVIHSLHSIINEGGKIGIITSRVGSLGDNGSGGNYGYRMSKAAANMMGLNLSHELRHRKIAVAMLHPGLVATEMTNGNGIEPSIAASGLIARMDELTLQSSGQFWHAEGYELPW